MAKKKGKSKKQLIPAVGYLRKSTKGLGADGLEKQEKSIAQQKTEIKKLVAGRYEIIGWYDDPGVSGWKRGAKRPGFARMMEEVEGLGAQAIVCDHIDRFSRASVGDVQEDANKLRKKGVRWIITASNNKVYDLGAKYDIGVILDFVVAVWSACNFSRDLGRRVSIARRNKAEQGLRTGGRPPYGMKSDDKNKGLLLHGDKQKVKTVLWMFKQYGNQAWSANQIAGDLNKRGVKSSKGGKWSSKIVNEMLRRRAYRGDFAYNEEPQGQWYRVDDQGEVNPNEEGNGEKGKVFVQKKAYKPLVPVALFDKVQRRLDRMSKDHGERKRKYALAGILYCGMCGSPMSGRTRGDVVSYYCSGNSGHGRGACGYHHMREDKAIHWIARKLREEKVHLDKLHSEPPEELENPQRVREDDRARLEGERDNLAAQIKTANKRLVLVENDQIFKDLVQTISGMRDELDQLDAKLDEEPPTAGMTDMEYDALEQWYVDFYTKAVKIPLGDDPTADLDGILDTTGDGPPIDGRYEIKDPALTREKLQELRLRVTFWWETRKHKTTGGLTQNKHDLSRIRWNMGDREGEVNPAVFSDTFALPPV